MWDTLLPTMIYAYRTKAQEAMGISPYEALFGMASRNVNVDPLQDPGVKLGMERLFFLIDKKITKEENSRAKKEQDYEVGHIHIGSSVIMVRHNKKNKLDSTFCRKVYTVVVKFHNNTYVLLNENGVKFKRAVSGNQIKVIVKRGALGQNL
ncbi:hypothetical protein RMATCC62417_04477 [Rhizopus microsporus]|nr:hypothetical protein RMATCC62417_04477 [Rhizopus microsporus]